MNKRSQSNIPKTMASLVALVLVATVAVLAQDNAKPETIHATAMGQLRASGKTFGVTINIASYSTPADQRTLIDAFNAGGHDALAEALSKMKSKGRVAISGTPGLRHRLCTHFSDRQRPAHSVDHESPHPIQRGLCE